MASRKILQTSILMTIGLLVNLLLILGVPAAGRTAVTVEILHDFPVDGVNPQAKVIEGSDGKLYGTTIIGGTSNQGTVFSMAKNGTGFVLLKSFNGCNTLTDGCNPVAGLIQASDGNLYGTTIVGGAGGGTVYRLITTATVLADFFLHGSGPTANPSTLFLDGNSPTATTAKSKDSVAIKFSDGNPWTQIGAWTAAATLSSGTVSALSNLRTWL